MLKNYHSCDDSAVDAEWQQQDDLPSKMPPYSYQQQCLFVNHRPTLMIHDSDDNDDDEEEEASWNESSSFRRRHRLLMLFGVIIGIALVSLLLESRIITVSVMDASLISNDDEPTRDSTRSHHDQPHKQHEYQYVFPLWGDCKGNCSHSDDKQQGKGKSSKGSKIVVVTVNKNYLYLGPHHHHHHHHKHRSNNDNQTQEDNDWKNNKWKKYVTKVQVVSPTTNKSDNSSSAPSNSASTPAVAGSCHASPNCNALGLTGDCCPTRDGTVLECCNNEPSSSSSSPTKARPSSFDAPTLSSDASCSTQPDCLALNLTGKCCPTIDMVYLDCCRNDTTTTSAATKEHPTVVSPSSETPSQVPTKLVVPSKIVPSTIRPSLAPTMYPSTGPSNIPTTGPSLEPSILVPHRRTAFDGTSSSPGKTKTSTPNAAPLKPNVNIGRRKEAGRQ